MADVTQRIAIITIGLAFVFLISAMTFSALQPNDLVCDRMISTDDGQELLLFDCARPNVDFPKRMVRVVIK